MKALDAHRSPSELEQGVLEPLLLEPIATALYVSPKPGRPMRDALESRGRLILALQGVGLSAARLKLRRCGTSRRVVQGPHGDRVVPWGCRAAYCPVCALNRRNRLFARLRPWVKAGIGLRGGVVLATFAHRPGDGCLPERLWALAKRLRGVCVSRAWREKFRAQVGVVVALEVSEGVDGRGHPHAHLFVFSQELERLEEFVVWLQDWWLERNPECRPNAKSIAWCGRHPDDWAPRLRYVLKGSPISPDWPKGLIEEAVEVMGSGRRMLTFWGLAERKGGWFRPEKARSQLELAS